MEIVPGFFIVAAGILAAILYRSRHRHPLTEQVMGRWIDFLPPVPPDFEIYSSPFRLEGAEDRSAIALAFMESGSDSLRFESSTNSPTGKQHRVVGLVGNSELPLGHLPSVIGDRIVGSRLADMVGLRLLRVYVSNSGYVDITLQVIGPKVKKAQFEYFDATCSVSSSGVLET